MRVGRKSTGKDEGKNKGFWERMREGRMDPGKG